MLGRDISLTYKLLLFVLIAAILPVVLMSISSFTTYNAIQDDVTSSIDEVKRIAVSDLEKNLKSTRDDKIDKYSKILNGIEKQAETAALYTETNWEHFDGNTSAAAFNGMVWAGPYNDQAKRTAYRGQINRLSHVGVLLQQMDAAENFTSLVYFGTPANNVVTSKNITGTLEELEDGFSNVERPWYQRADEERRTVWTNTYVDAHTHELTTTVAAPATSDGDLIGVVGADVTLGVLSDDILETDPGFAFLLDSDGETIVYPGMRAPEKTVFAERTFNGTNFLEDDAPDELRMLAQDMVDGKRGIREVTIEGEETFVAYGPLETNDWSVGIAVPVAETTEQVRALEEDVDIDENIRNAMYEYAALLILMLLIVTGTGLYFSHHITQPIIDLHEKAESISKGGIGDEVDINTGDEIEDLADSFNRVIRTIKILQQRDAPTAD